MMKHLFDDWDEGTGFNPDPDTLKSNPFSVHYEEKTDYNKKTENPRDIYHNKGLRTFGDMTFHLSFAPLAQPVYNIAMWVAKQIDAPEPEFKEAQAQAREMILRTAQYFPKKIHIDADIWPILQLLVCDYANRNEINLETVLKAKAFATAAWKERGYSEPSDKCPTNLDIAAFKNAYPWLFEDKSMYRLAAQLKAKLFES